jgi:5-(carboxyamino)imidazole ribonucleotide synthase
MGSRRVQSVGIIGGGQLAGMIAPAARRLGLDLWVQTPNPTDPAVALATSVVLAPIADVTGTQELSSHCDVVTFENEFVDLPGLQKLAEAGVCFRPALRSLEPLLDKYHQRSFLRDTGLPTPEFISPAPELPSSFPTVLKTRRMGYDGQGTFILKNLAEYKEIVQKLGAENLLLETFIPFKCELAVMAARSASGEIKVYPVVETEQQDQVCRWVLAPAEVSAAVVEQVHGIATSILTALDGVGVFGIELFLTQDDRLYVNEIAPRTHNSGHYTIDACATSQFEQQLRAVCDLPLGDVGLNCGAAVMVNLLGFESVSHNYQGVRDRLAAIPGAVVHWYGKAESRPGRKLGHVTVRLERGAGALAIVEKIEGIWLGR